MEIIQLFITDITTLLVNVFTRIGSGSILIAPFIFWLITNVILLFRMLLSFSYRTKGF